MYFRPVGIRIYIPFGSLYGSCLRRIDETTVSKGLGSLLSTGIAVSERRSDNLGLRRFADFSGSCRTHIP